MIIVIDSIMGSGKTTWAIRHMNRSPQRKFIFATPFLEEDRRIMEKCPSIDFVEPKGVFSKLSDLKALIAAGRSIVTTHALLDRWIPTPKDIEHLRQWNYTLILDEAIEVVKPIENLNRRDVDMLLGGMIELDEASGRVRWIAEDFPQRYKDVQSLAKAGRLYLSRDSQLLDVMPVNLLRAFPNLIVMTFFFEASHLCHFMQLHNLPFKKAYIRDLHLIMGEEDLTAEKERIRRLLTIYDGKLNDVGDEPSSLSATFWKSARNREKQKAVLNRARSYLESLHRAKSRESMWSVFLGINGKQMRQVKNYATSFVPFNSKATNNYRDRRFLAYLVNVYENPMISGWFAERGSALNSDRYALSVMIQWIWRSALRDGKPVQLYLPSKRMRNILRRWLD